MPLLTIELDHINIDWVNLTFRWVFTWIGVSLFMLKFFLANDVALISTFYLDIWTLLCLFCSFGNCGYLEFDIVERCVDIFVGKKVSKLLTLGQIWSLYKVWLLISFLLNNNWHIGSLYATLNLLICRFEFRDQRKCNYGNIPLLLYINIIVYHLNNCEFLCVCVCVCVCMLCMIVVFF